MGTDSEYPRAIWTAIFFVLMCFGAGGIEGQTRRIPNDEMEALGEIAEQLGKKDWNLSVNHCDENGNWYTPIKYGLTYNSTVNCTCPDECHISAIYLLGQDLSGVLPKSIAKLRYLKYIDLTRNYLSGSILSEWASTNLEYMKVSMNRLSRPIPKYLGMMTSLTNMSLESNMFNGTVPAELGNLVNLQYFNLNSNNLTGELPKELSSMTNLTEVRMSSNNFAGKLPSFQSWKQLRILELEASGFEGPIPSDISLLRNLTELRITDLKEGASKFPPLENMTGLTKLMLRSCNISGPIPPYLVNLPLTTLDLSYNRLEGNIPNFENANRLQWIYLTRNFLTGLIPPWITGRPFNYEIDLSYNNFSESATDQAPCNKNTLNLFRSFSSGSNLDFEQCLKNSPCLGKDRCYLHINCGGENVTIGKTTYEEDVDQGGSARFDPGPNWGFSSTGFFWDTNRTASYYIATNVSVLRMNDSQLYTSARLSPLSLTYYGRCLANGNYTVTLRFAEIIFRDNQSFQSLGRRMFDVYIQDIRVLTDFDIEAAGKGVDKAVVRNFDNIAVKNKTIEIRFYWAGKGTRVVPTRGTYGALVSAISVVASNKLSSLRFWFPMRSILLLLLLLFLSLSLSLS